MLVNSPKVGLILWQAGGREWVHQQIVAKMREKASDQAAFAKLLRLLHNAARQKQPLPSLKNHVLDAGMLKDCLQQVRMSSGFPIPPDPEESEAASSLFQQEMVNVVENRGDPDVVPFTMLFVRLGADVLSLVKARLFRGLVFVKLGLLTLLGFPMCRLLTELSSKQPPVTGRCSRLPNIMQTATNTSGVFATFGHSSKYPRLTLPGGARMLEMVCLTPFRVAGTSQRGISSDPTATAGSSLQRFGQD